MRRIIKSINPFLDIYIEMARLALTQRAAINDIETDIANICTNVGEGLDENDTEAISEVWKKYIIFQNELHIPEPTF